MFLVAMRDRRSGGELRPGAAVGPVSAGPGRRRRAPARRWPGPRRRSSGSTTRGVPTPRAGRPSATARRTWSWSAAATPGCGPRCWPASADPDRSVTLLEAGLCGWEASGPQRRLRLGEPHPRLRATAASAGPTSSPSSTGSARRTSAAIGRTGPRPRHRLRLGADRGARPSPRRPHQVEELRALAGEMAAGRPRGRAAGRRRRRAPRSTPRRTSAALRDAHGTAMVEPARLAWGLRQACLDAGVRIHERHPRHRPGARRARACGSRTGGGASCARRPGGAGHERVPAAAAPAPADDGAGLRPRADDRAADARRSWPRSAGRGGRGSATPRTSSTTTG